MSIRTCVCVCWDIMYVHVGTSNMEVLGLLQYECIGTSVICSTVNTDRHIGIETNTLRAL